MHLLASIVRLITAVVVGLIVLGIALRLLDANSGNALASFVLDLAGWLVTPFKSIFRPDGENVRILVNWGLAAIVYAIVGGVIASLLARATLGRGGHGRARRGAVG